MGEELKQHRELLREDINKLTKTSIMLGWIWIGFSILTIISSVILLCFNKKMIDTSVILISNAVFLVLFICNIFILCLLWWRNKTEYSGNNKTVQGKDETAKIEKKEEIEEIVIKKNC